MSISQHSAFYSKVGRLELDLGQLELNHHRTLQKVVYTPVSDTVAREFPVRGRWSAFVLRPLSVVPVLAG